MNIIKLNAIDSTNSYIKKLASKTDLESYTVVQAKHQTLGRGQLGATWISETGKNLTFSILINFKDLKVQHQFYLSMAVSLGVLESVKNNVKIALAVKWPNDILADRDKVAGILIENIIKGSKIKESVIGIGLNVNQKDFPKSIGNATSLQNISGINFDKDSLLKNIVSSIKYYVGYVEKKEFGKVKKLYIASLYKYYKPTMFEDKDGVVFLGKIIDVSEEGKLVVELENETTRKFSLKEIKFASH
ncbi:biotin--[acetyl-CoA-carboxylase] ligase [bacterium AH-315-A23]|nr:biotin--[acetyl-CoA-carboxylase] ligase [bacterium AH-315-A23]PHS53818.1 MAG: biotin--[acetyl-CoA-carboxylase] ligase [Lutibacter sp.]